MRVRGRGQAEGCFARRGRHAFRLDAAKGGYRGVKQARFPSRLRRDRFPSPLLPFLLRSLLPRGLLLRPLVLPPGRPPGSLGLRVDP